MSRLEGRTALVTGGTTGIGYATAERFRREGARVIITGQDEGRVARAAERLGPGVIGIRADVTRVEDLDRLAAEARERFERIDVLFVNAGIGYFAPIEQVDEAFFDRQFGVNVRGAFFTVQRLAPLIPAGGSVVLNASTVHGKGFAGGAVYAATKAALRSLARNLAAELAPRGIRVNSVSPGYVPTEIQQKMGLPPEQIDAFEQSITARTPLARAGSVEEIAAAVTFLGSPDASYITGSDLLVDGGFASV